MHRDLLAFHHLAPRVKTRGADSALLVCVLLMALQALRSTCRMGASLWITASLPSKVSCYLLDVACATMYV
jgi:hypothetical protein